MNGLGLLLCAGCALALFFLPRRWAVLPLLVGCCYVTTGQGFEIGSFSLPVYRVLLLVGLTRILLRGEHVAGGVTTADKLMFTWCLWTCFASFFQPWETGSGPKYVSGNILNVAGAYFVIRALCRDADDLTTLVRGLCIILVPVAAAMLYESMRHQNLFAIFGRVPEMPLMRGNRFRAQGPFSHPILAGTVGAACLPLIVVLWSRHRITALVGALACLVMVFATASSGPILSVMVAGFAVWMWTRRRHCKTLVKLAIAGYLVLEIVMSRPPYFLIASIDLAGGSTGWHRAFLIQQTIGHFREWALFGTNHTREWMPGQGYISETQTDITNYYIFLGVMGGFLCMALAFAMIWRAFKSVGEYVRHPASTAADSFVIWCIGASLFAQCTSSFSIAYFGQTPIFFWLPVALIASLRATLAETLEPAKTMRVRPAGNAPPLRPYQQILGARTYSAPVQFGGQQLPLIPGASTRVHEFPPDSHHPGSDSPGVLRLS